MSKQKVLEIDLKIKALQEKKKKLEERQYLQLAQLIKKSGAISLSSEILIGALLDAVKSVQENIDVVKKWQQAGVEFLKSGKVEAEVNRDQKSKDASRR